MHKWSTSWCNNLCSFLRRHENNANESHWFILGRGGEKTKKAEKQERRYFLSNCHHSSGCVCVLGEDKALCVSVYTVGIVYAKLSRIKERPQWQGTVRPACFFFFLPCRVTGSRLQEEKKSCPTSKEGIKGVREWGMASIKLHHPTSPLKATGRRPTGQSPHKRGQRLSLQWAASPAVALTSRGQRDRETERDTGTERRHFKDSQQGHLKQMDREEWKGGVGWSTGTGGVTWRPWCTHEVWVSCIRWEQWCQMSTFMPAQWHLIQRQTDRHNKKIYTRWSDKTHTRTCTHLYNSFHQTNKLPLK